MLDADEQRVVNDIARHGWHLIQVPPDAEGPGFVYSIGMMETLNHPEIVIFGLDGVMMMQMVNGIGEEIIAGRPFREEGLYDGLLQGFACKFKPVASRFHTEYLGYAMWHRRHVGKIGILEAMQCLWPDKRGLFPDETGCHPEIAHLQPLLQ
jgi:hypothetical protein